MNLAATFETIDVIELIAIFGLAFGVIAVCISLYRRGGRRPD